MSLGSLFQQNTDTDPVKSQSELWHLEEHGSEGLPQPSCTCTPPC